MTDTEISRQNQTCPFAYPFDRPSTLGVSALYEEIRGGEGTVPVTLPSGDSGFIVTRYDDVKTVFGDRRFSRAATLQPDAPRLGPAPQNFPTLLNMDAPDHSRVRKMIAGSFTARRVETLRPRVQEHVDELITAMVEAGPGADLMTAYAAPLPVLVICELLGVPFEDREKFGQWSRAFLATTSAEFTKDEVTSAQISLVQYLADLLVSKAADPQDDLLSELAVRNAQEQNVSQAELIFLGVTLLVAGHETTVNMITNGLLALLTHPDQLELLKSDPGLTESAVEEILRVFVPGNEALLRIATEDVELGGVVVPAGQAVLPSVLSANRDERTFTDPSRFDITRREGQHLTFGSGPHFCIGASLARIELTHSFRELVRRLPGLALSVDVAEVERSEGRLVNGVTKLPITWDDGLARCRLAQDRAARNRPTT